MLPEETKTLKKIAESLPNGDCSPVAPFTGLVANLNVATVGHRDLNDQTLCAVLGFDHCIGGYFMMYESGIIIQIRTGDWLAFNSDKFTHLNEHVVGKRASFVFHTDAGFRNWVEGNFNGWGNSQAFARPR